jgi:aspartate aminotransferase
MISARVESITPSGSDMLAQKVIELRNQGRDIISLSVGEPDFKTPQEILNATKKALDEGETRYSLVHGIPELREAIAKKLWDENRVSVNPEQIVLSHGSKQTLYNIFQTILNPDDEVIIPVPYWVTFPESVKLAGGRPIFVDCPNLQLDPELIEKAITSKTKAIIVNSPNNPSGAVFSPESLKKLSEIVVKNNLILISDEAYERFTYEDLPHLSPASISEEVFQRTLTVHSFSKTYCMTGFRLGYVAGPDWLIKPMIKLQSHLTGNNAPFAQFGALEALQMDPGFFQDMKKIFDQRRKMSFEQYKNIFELEMPQGAFYLFGKMTDDLIKRFGDDEKLAHHILEKAGVALLPGNFFGKPLYLRLSFAASEQDLKEAARRIKEVL